jgi:hypothetical protein
MQRATLALCAALSLIPASAAHADTDRQSRTLPLKPGQPIVVDITVGDVRLEGWSRPDVLLEITRTAPTAAALSQIPVEVASDGELVIRARQVDGGTNARLRTDLSLKVPHDAVIKSLRIMEGRLTLRTLRGSLSADVQRGPIDAEDISGTVRLETSIGDITARSARLTSDGLLRLRTFNGNVLLQLAQQPAHARIMALALNGTVSSQIPLNMKDKWGPRWGEATLGSGEPVISIDVITGKIAITVRAP